MHEATVSTKLYTYIVHHTRHFTSKEISYSLIVQISLHIHWQGWPFMLKIGWIRRNLVFDKNTLLLVLFLFAHAIGIQLFSFSVIFGLPVSLSIIVQQQQRHQDSSLVPKFEDQLWILNKLNTYILFYHFIIPSHTIP